MLICKIEPFWQEVSVESLILRWLLRPRGLLFIFFLLNFTFFQMPEKKALNASARRLKDKLRKREKRLQKSSSSTTSAESTVPCGSVDGADAAPPSNFLGQVSMGFPLKEEKSLARMQASPRVKMHPPAPRLPSPRGSRLFVREQDKAPSPDSPAWICAPARAPGSDPVHGSGPAGQAQLEGAYQQE